MLSVLVTLAVVLFDILTKYIVKTSMEPYESFNVIPGLFNFTYVLNKGAAWGMFADKRWIFMVFSTLAIILLVVVLIKARRSSRLLKIALSLILGGGIGNMIDRIFNGDKLFDGAVVDFIETAFMDFPVFNIADSAVCIGAGLMILYMILDFIKENKAKKQQNTGGDLNE